MCESDSSPFHAARFGPGPIYGLQFHAELDRDENHERYRHYIHLYGDEEEGESLEFSPSTDSNTLLGRFLRLYC